MAQAANDQVSITFDDKKVREMLAAAPERTMQTVRQLLEKAGIDVMAEMRREAPVGVTGDLRRTTHYVFQGDMAVVVEPTANYAEDVEKGTSPHWVAVEGKDSPLARWAAQKGINPYAVQRSIAKKGTKAHPFIQPTYDIMEPKVQRDFENGIERFIGQLNG